MIDKREILEAASSFSLLPNVVEKDYVLGWILAGINAHEEIAESWVFKGGTCLKKCYFETYRFSEDLDFTLRNETRVDEEFLKSVFEEVVAWVAEQSGLNIPSDQLDTKNNRVRQSHRLLQTRNLSHREIRNTGQQRYHKAEIHRENMRGKSTIRLTTLPHRSTSFCQQVIQILLQVASQSIGPSMVAARFVENCGRKTWEVINTGIHFQRSLSKVGGASVRLRPSQPSQPVVCI